MKIAELLLTSLQITINQNKNVRVKSSAHAYFEKKNTFIIYAQKQEIEQPNNSYVFEKEI